MYAFVHLSDIWGDSSDASGLRSNFRETIRQLRDTNELAIIVETDSARARVAQLTWPDSQRLEFTDLENVDWRDPRITSVGVDLRGASPRDAKDLDVDLRAAGFRRAGRAWGEAGESRRYLRLAGLPYTARAALSEVKVSAGAAIVRFRDTWLSPDRRQAWATRTRAKISTTIDSRDVLDDRYGHPLPLPGVVNARDLLPEQFGIEEPTWTTSLASERDPMDVAQQCFDQHGVWPISFSYPKVPADLNPAPQDLLAPIVPGLPYTFTDEQEYLRTYREAYLGLTHRKAGWDCFRHVEILASGAVPLMPDSHEIPEYSMIHYPKSSMGQVIEAVRHTGGPPDSLTRHEFRHHFERHLTTRAMVEYIILASGLDGMNRVLFVDMVLPRAADYLSALTLIGLKQLLGSQCHVLHPVDYIYVDTLLDTHQLYGRGFGYSRSLSGELRSSTELGYEAPELQSFDAVVVGSIARNYREARELLSTIPAQRTVWIHGEDTPPTLDQAHELRSSGVHTFVRSIHTGRR